MGSDNQYITAPLTFIGLLTITTYINIKSAQTFSDSAINKIYLSAILNIFIQNFGKIN